MAYTPQTWADAPATTSPINATRLGHIETGLDEASDAADAAATAAAAKYTKPGGGIPSTDMTSAVVTSLGKADSALQSAPVTSVASKTGAVTLVKADVGLGSVDNLQQQPIDADLTAIAALTSAADKVLYATGAGTWALSTLTSFIRTVLDDADAATARATLGVAASPVVGTTTTGSTITATVGGSPYVQYNVTALAANATIAAPSGAPASGDRLTYRIKDNATSHTLSWNSIFRAVGVTMPTATTISKTLYVGCIYNSDDTKWDVVAVALEA